MSIQVFFNRPEKPFDTRMLIDEIRNSSKCLAIVSGWFTNREVAQAFIDSRAKQKLCIIDANDKDIETQRVYKMISKYFNNTGENRSQLFKNQVDGFYPVKSVPWNESGKMHHKFILIDFDIVWTGSYNFTYNAMNSYENILRIRNRTLCDQFWEEAETLCHEDWNRLLGIAHFPPGATVGRYFCCFDCEQIYSISELGHTKDWAICKDCCEH